MKLSYLTKLFKPKTASSPTKYRKAPLMLMGRIKRPLYDRIVLTPETLLGTWFQDPMGAADPVTKRIKTSIQTNMDQSGSLPYPKNFEIDAIRLEFYQYTSDPASPIISPSPEEVKILEDYWVRFFIGEKDHLTVNAFMLMNSKVNSSGGPCCDECGKASTDVVSVYCGRPNRIGTFVLAESVDLIPQQRFRFEIVKPELAKAITKPVVASLYLDGHFKREVA